MEAHESTALRTPSGHTRLAPPRPEDQPPSQSPGDDEPWPQPQRPAGRRLRRIASAVVCRAIGGLLEMFRHDFPPLVRIETTNACNAKCIICPHRRLERPIGRIDQALFDRIIAECGLHGCREIHLHNFGEPLLDPRLPERVAQAKAAGIRKVKIFSNGSLLTEQRTRQLIDAGLDELKISFDGATREEFERIRPPLKFDEVVANIRMAVEIRDELDSPMRIKVACCATTDRAETMRQLSKVVDGFSFGKIHNWNGLDDDACEETETLELFPTDEKIRRPCSRLWRTLTVLADGRISLCCLDYEGQHILGLLDGDTTIIDVWNSERYRRVRRIHRCGNQDKLILCRNCSKAQFG